MNFKIIDSKEFNSEVLNNLNNHSVFSSLELIKLHQMIFDFEYKYALLINGENIEVILPIIVEKDQVTSLGHLTNTNIFDYFPISYTDKKYIQLLLLELMQYVDENNLKLSLREIPIELVNEFDEKELLEKLSRCSVLPICNVEKNEDVKSGKIIFKKKYRRELKRKTNKINNQFESKYVLEVNKDEGTNSFLTFFSKSNNQEKRDFLTNRIEDFMQNLVGINNVKLTGFYFDDELVSVAVYYDEDNVRYLYNMASNTDYSEYSPGLIHIARMVEDTVANNFDAFNFLRGAERYKFEIGANSCSWNMELVIGND